MAEAPQPRNNAISVTACAKRTHRKTGCVPCKIRKKRCSEHKPVCTDCQRLGFYCVYLPEKCPKEKVQYYREKVEKQLLEKKTTLDRRKASGVVQAEAQSSSINEVVPEESGGTSVSNDEKEGQHVVSNDGLDESQRLLDVTNVAELLGADGGSDSLIPGLLSLSGSPLSPRTLASTPAPSLSDPVLAELDDTALHLYQYYRDRLALIVSIAPSQQNHYRKIFLPMAHQNEGVMYGLLAWAARHLSLTVDENDTALDGSAAPSSLVAGPLTDPRYTELANKYTLFSLQRLSYRNSGFLMSLAQILVLCGAEICQGDVTRWQTLLQCATSMIKEHAPDGDIGALLAKSELASSLADTQTTRWLLSNFVYHDIMGSDQTHFPMSQYARVLQNPMNPLESPVDPLHGVNRPVFQILGQVKNLARQVKQELRQELQRSGDLDEKDETRDPRDSASPTAAPAPSRETMAIAQELQGALYRISPSESDLAWYDNFAEIGSDIRPLAETLFSVFRTAALILLKTAVLRQTTDSYEIRFLVSQLSDELDCVLGSQLEGGLCFPLFICGINAHDRAQRISVEIKFADFIKRYKFRNVERALVVMRQLWESADNGVTQDWFDIVDSVGWDLNFA
ncbi:Uga3p [Lachancea thermotolerans CBS 6340]|uniref:KLTH0H00968p n=1 Tax=Lachancea thermotolerans (strain ATCC 56472 / CBS 6340 / NRRL Y-8284) TaxID=559295 RepID=C5E1Z9_LACTC|nr:KLTH0H00968p [Lachancea thermotolerans CBS 6340]CAR30060.1 KLTH0H00968p [Lachancea thermotolerans CBS 6340]